MSKIKKILRNLDMVIVFMLMPIFTFAHLKFRHKFLIKAYRRWGMRMKEWPNYISSGTDIDGTDYSQIYLGEGVTISSYVRLLTHDWSPHTVGKQLGIYTSNPMGRFGGITIEDFSFIGTGSIVMPGTHIGKGCIIGAGTVARGRIEDYSLVLGSPGKVVGDTRSLMLKWSKNENWNLSEEQILLLESAIHE